MSCLCFGEKEEVFFWFVEIRDVLCPEMATLFTHIKGKILEICQSSVFHTVWYFQNCWNQIASVKTEIKPERHFQIKLNLMWNSVTWHTQHSHLLWHELYLLMFIPAEFGSKGLTKYLPKLRETGRWAPRWNIKLFNHKSLNIKTTGIKSGLDLTVPLHVEVPLTLLGNLYDWRVKWTYWIKVMISSGL